MVRSFAKVSGPARRAVAEKESDDIGNSLYGATAASTAQELVTHRKDWEFLGWAGDLTRSRLLVIGASKGGGEENRRLAEAVARDGGDVTALTLPSDHSFQDHRIALAAALVDWLQKLPTP